MGRLLPIAGALVFGLCGAAHAERATTCSKMELLTLTNEIDFMSSPSQQENRCIALQEVMKARAAMDFKNDARCQEHVHKAILTMRGHPPSDLKAVKDCGK